MSEECEELEGMGPATPVPPGMGDVVVLEGFVGENIRTRFIGKMIVVATNHAAVGPNSREWHNWILYAIPPDGQKVFRVVDEYKTLMKEKCGHTKLTAPLTAAQVAVKYARLANTAILEGAVGEEVFTLDAAEKSEVK